MSFKVCIEEKKVLTLADVYWEGKSGVYLVRDREGQKKIVVLSCPIGAVLLLVDKRVLPISNLSKLKNYEILIANITIDVKEGGEA